MVSHTKGILTSAPAASYCMWVSFSCGCLLGALYTISLNDNLTESFRMTVKSGMMRDPTLFNQTGILNEKFLAQCSTSCRAECKHERCTLECVHEKGMFGDFVSIESQKKSETETLGEEAV
jgi:hypothetical protein